MKVRLKEYKDCVNTTTVTKEILCGSKTTSFGKTLKVKRLRGDENCFQAEDGWNYAMEWVEDIVEVPVQEENNYREDINKMFKKLSELVRTNSVSIILNSPISSEKPTWSFKNDKINWELLCLDLLEENIPLAFVTDNNKHYIVGVWNDIFDWQHIFSEHFVSDYFDTYDTHDIFEVTNPEECKKLVKKFTQRFKQAHKIKRKKVLKRSKELKKTKEFKVYSY